jgi:alcohol dehydrogenase
MTPFDFRPRARVVFGAGEFARLGELARDLGGTRCLLVGDAASLQAACFQEAGRSLKARRMEVLEFGEVTGEPTTTMVEKCAALPGTGGIDLIVALGGDPVMDCAKAINFVASNGGRIQDYWGYGKAARPMIPMLAIPTCAGAGGEAQSVAAVIDAESGRRMACGDAKLAFRTALLDPRLTLAQSAPQAATAACDALAHALETLVSTRRTALSDCFAHAAWRLLHSHLERVLADPEDLDARGALLVGAHFGGVAVENSTLGAAHACAYPLTASFGIPHSTAVALVLAPVVRWNSQAVAFRYRELYPGDLVQRLGELAEKAGVPAGLGQAGVPREALPRLAEEAGLQWHGKFNPRPFHAEGAHEIYEMAY